jgi:hypothetical protein
MSLTKAEVTTLLGKFAHSLHETTTTSEFMDVALWELAKNYGPMVGSTTGNLSAPVGIYSFPATAVNLLCVIARNKELSLQSTNDLEYHSITWRDDTVTSGTTDVNAHFSYMVDEVSGRKFSIYPIPSTATTDGYTVVYTEARTTTIPEWLVLPIVFDTLAREFAFPSDHQDKDFAALCAEIATLCYAILGYA